MINLNCKIMQRKWVCQKCGQVRAISGGPKPDATRCVKGGTHVWKEEKYTGHFWDRIYGK